MNFIMYSRDSEGFGMKSGRKLVGRVRVLVKCAEEYVFNLFIYEISQVCKRERACGRL